MAWLDNPAESPCFGCGPQHPRGLRLRFERRTASDGVDEVVAHHTPKEDEVGWPGLFHTGLHYLVVYEACYWGAWELGGKVCVPRGPSTWDQRRLPLVGQPFEARARLVERTAEGVRVRAVSEGGGKVLGALDAGFRFSSRAFIERAGLKLPSYLLDDMAP